MLPYLTDDQIEEVSILLEKKFPVAPPGNHVNVGACIRFIYGQFEKKGILRSDDDFKRMKKEKLNWDRSAYFLKILYNKLKENKNYYGVSILCEMNAHRIGDKAVIDNDEDKLIEMEELYNKSIKYAHKCNSYKQMFTPYYWAFRYFSKSNKVVKALFYAYSTIEEAHKYCPDGRPGYVTKLMDCARYIRSNDKDSWKKFYKKYKNSKNKCVKKVFKKVA
jgi:hypothetical protein